MSLRSHLDINEVLNSLGKALFEDWNEGLVEEYTTKDLNTSYSTVYDHSGLMLPYKEQKKLQEELQECIKNYQEKKESKDITLPIFILPKNIQGEYNTSLGNYSPKTESSKKIFQIYNEKDLVFLKNLLKIRSVRNELRDALFSGKITACVYQDKEFIDLPPLMWEDDELWVRLILDGRIFTTINEFSYYMGKVSFKIEEVEAFLKSLFQTSYYVDTQDVEKSLEKLFDFRKPWLGLLNEIALDTPHEKIEGIEKKQLIRDVIEPHAKRLALEPSPKKLQYLATFLRSADQEKGKGNTKKHKKPN